MKDKRQTIVSGILLILLGFFFLTLQVMPQFREWFDLTNSWPALIILIGAGIFLSGLIFGVPDMVIPGSVVSGIGAILYWQNATGNWESWSYVWALIPGFVGIGVTVAGLVKGKRKEIMDGLEAILVSAVLFVIFGSLLGPFPLGPYWPLLVIGIGVVLLVRAIFGARD